MNRKRVLRAPFKLTAAALALGAALIAGSAITTPAEAATPGEVASFEASNVPGNYIRHRNALGEISVIRSELDRADATWTIRPALNGRQGAVSFESVNYPGTFLRHQMFRIKQHRNDGSQLFKDDASFYVRRGLIGGDTVSFEATNVAGQFIRHRNFELWITASDGSDLFKKDASFRQKPGLDGQVAMNAPRTFESANYPGRYIRHRFALGEITPVISDLDMRDATWVLRPALNGAAGAVSFESTNYPGTYLRHQNYRIKQHRSDGSQLFKDDASFFVRPGLSGLPGTVSFEAAKPAGYFIRHQNNQLWISSHTTGYTPTFLSDATFRQGGPGFRVSDAEVSLEALSPSGQFLRHRMNLGDLTPINPASNLDRADSTFIKRPGLSGLPGTVSFESKNYPGFYLRHQAYRIKLSRDDGTETHLFRMDASFYEKPGLANGSGKSYEAVNAAGYFIRHRNFQFWISQSDGSELFRKDATFLVRAPQFIEPGACTAFFRRWRTGIDDDSKMEVCTWVMGISQYCKARNAYPAQQWQGNRRYLICVENWQESSFIEELEALTNGIGQQMLEAYNAVAPFVGPVVSGLGCINGVIYACATLALEIADAAGVLPPGVASEAIDIAGNVGKCVDGNITACAQLGARGAKVAGLTIPAADAARVAEDVRKCANGEFGACVRLGMKAAEAAGVPLGLGAGDVADAGDCLTGDNNACIALAKRAVQAGTGIPLGGVVNGTENARKCANGDNDACIALGKALVQAAG